MPGIITSRFPTQQDILNLAAQMRSSDQQELAVTCGYPPLEAVWRSVLVADPEFLQAWHVDGQLLCLAGCAAISAERAAPWLLATELMNRYVWRLTREARLGVGRMLQRYAVLQNIIDARQLATIRWLQALGFEMVCLEADREFPVWHFQLRRA